MHLLIQYRFSIIKGLVCISLGIGAGFFVGYMQGQAGVTNSIKNSLSPIEQQGTSYNFVHPLLAYRTPEATVFNDYISLKNDLNTIVTKATHTGATRVSIYFRDLDIARWIGINQNDSYYPASLLKVPTMIALYKQAEENSTILQTSVVYNPNVLPNDPFSTPSLLTKDRSYSIQELINYMITDSDNGATFTLLDRMSPDFLHQVYAALGIQDPGDDSAVYKISARTYGLFFRVLYNATYLSSYYSEQALRLLSQSTFKDGLVAGVPAGTVVAHKYGEHVLSDNGAVTGVELSDCGIVYYPAHPYLLCVMTSTPDVPTAVKIIANVSNVAYNAVHTRYATTTPSS